MTGEAAREAFYRALLDDNPEDLYDRAPCGYLSTTPDGTIVKVNQTFLTWTGYSRTELVGRRTFAELLTMGGRMYHETHYGPRLRMEGAAREVALDIVCSDGARLPVLVNSVLERAEDGTPTVVRTAVFDATERREYERELVRARQRAEASEERATLLARTLQHTLIPPLAPQIPGVEVATAYRPAGDGSEVGGDFYDVFQRTTDDWIVAIGDVCGKGVEAAIVTSLARGAIRAAAARDPRPSTIVRDLNDVLFAADPDRYCTVAIARLRRRDHGWSAVVALGGHPLPLHVRDGRVEVVGVPGTAAGVLPEVEVEEVEVLLEPGSVLLLYTDGVPEARGHGAFFGEDGISGAIAAHGSGARDVVDGLLNDVIAFQAGLPRDDVAIVAIGVP